MFEATGEWNVSLLKYKLMYVTNHQLTYEHGRQSYSFNSFSAQNLLWTENKH